MTEVRLTSGTGGEKGSKLARFDLIPVEPLLALAKHYGVGAIKYDDSNWKKGYDWKLSYAALQRHANEWWSGEEWGEEEFVDRETGETVKVVINHMIAVAWHAFALYWFSEDDFSRGSYSPEPFHGEMPGPPYDPIRSVPDLPSNI